MDTKMMYSVKGSISKIIKETDVLQVYTVILNKRWLVRDYKEADVLNPYTEIFNQHWLGRDYLEEESVLLKNIIFLLERNEEYIYDDYLFHKVYVALNDIRRFLNDLSQNVLLRKLHLLQASFQAVLGHLIPILYSRYLEHTEADISAELNCVLNKIEHIKSEAQEIKLYYFPRTDDLGFLEFFSVYLEDLSKNQEISIKEEIDALHFEVHSLLSFAKVRNQEQLNGTSWTDIINMAYQAEYIIDLYLVSSSRDLGLISSLSKIIEQLKDIRADKHGIYCESLLAQDLAVTSKPQVLGTTTNVSVNDAIVGFQEEASTITEYLLIGEKNLDVIAIVGMAGVGKTTLALTLYKTSSIVDHFDIVAWCTISQSYQNRDLLLCILDQVNAFDKSHRTISDDEELADHLCRSLKKRRYLIVLDDIWDTTLWNYLKRYLPDDNNCSRLLVTTRNSDVADQIGSNVNKLHRLSDKESWELFQKKMLDKETLSDDLLKISKGIVEHCKGLPLSIVIIAGILSDMERTEKKWNQIAESVSSLVLSDPQGKCKAILELSYNHLPNHLRSCFLYMGSFPEDEEISVTRLINLWIAEGLVRDKKSDSAEEVAKKYVENLIVRSLVIPAKERCGGGVKTFRLHDLLRDFCLVKAKEKHFFTVLDQRNDSGPLQDPRRLIVKGFHINDIYFSCHSIRSIFFDDLGPYDIKYRIGSCDMVLLKVLEVGVVQADLFPHISRLIHLRYLALGLMNEISVLPSSTSKLQNLQILILRCRYVLEVPDLIWDMMKLRHVFISPAASFQVDSNRLQNSSFLLENLRSLSNARVSWEDSEWLNKLSELQRLSCVFVDNEDDDLVEDDYLEEDVEDDGLEDCDDQEEYNDREEDEKGDDREEKAHLEANQFRRLSFHSHLTSLKVRNAADRKLRFICTFQLHIGLRELNLSKFRLMSNDVSDDISEIGRALPHLEVFKIYSCSMPSGYKWNVDDEYFPRLKVLKLRSLNISKWVASENYFPSLEQLWVEKCNHLEEIPLDFGFLPTLHLISVKECAPSVEDSAREIEKQQHEDQNTEMRVYIYRKKLSPRMKVSTST